MVGIYKLTNKVNGMSYIGQSVNVKRRYKHHKTTARNRSETAYVDSEMAKYGIDNFEFTILEECRKEDLDDREQYYIGKYDTVVPNGYNKTKGGRTGSLIAIQSRDDIDEIRRMLKDTNISEVAIAKKFGVTDTTVSTINTGKCWKEKGIEYPIRKYQNNKEPYPQYCEVCGKKVSSRRSPNRCRECYLKQATEYIPDKDTLYNLLLETTSFPKVGAKYGVGKEAVRKWCRKYGIPCYTEDYKKIKAELESK